MTQNPSGFASFEMRIDNRPYLLLTVVVVVERGRRRWREGVRFGGSAGRNEDSVKILGFWHLFVSRNPRNIRPESSSLVSTSLTHNGGDEDSEDSGIILLFLLLESPESSRRIQLQNVCVLYCSVVLQ